MSSTVLISPPSRRGRPPVLGAPPLPPTSPSACPAPPPLPPWQLPPFASLRTRCPPSPRWAGGVARHMNRAGAHPPGHRPRAQPPRRPPLPSRPPRTATATHPERPRRTAAATAVATASRGPPPRAARPPPGRRGAIPAAGVIPSAGAIPTAGASRQPRFERTHLLPPRAPHPRPPGRGAYAITTAVVPPAPPSPWQPPPSLTAAAAGGSAPVGSDPVRKHRWTNLPAAPAGLLGSPVCEPLPHGRVWQKRRLHMSGRPAGASRVTNCTGKVHAC